MTTLVVFSPSMDDSKKVRWLDDVCANLTISKEGVKALLLECDHKKPLGFDVLPNKFVRRYCDWASCFLAKIFNLSLCTPLSRIIGYWQEFRPCSNYRPISITCKACKVVENIISRKQSSVLS